MRKDILCNVNSKINKPDTFCININMLNSIKSLFNGISHKKRKKNYLKLLLILLKSISYMPFNSKPTMCTDQNY